MGIVEFLNARIDEDEAEARRAGADAMTGYRWKHYPEDAYGEVQSLVLAHSRRWLADCEAKRQMVELSWHHFGEDDYAWGMEEAKKQMLALMALAYKDHPDYRDNW